MKLLVYGIQTSKKNRGVQFVEQINRTKKERNVYFHLEFVLCLRTSSTPTAVGQQLVLAKGTG